MFVVKREKDGKYLKGRRSGTAEWVYNLSDARVFSRKGDATVSMRWGVAREDRTSKDALKVVPVTITEAPDVQAD